MTFPIQSAHDAKATRRRIAVLTADHLTRRFDARPAVQDLSFEIGRGEIFALLGPNGAGKTTTLRMLAGLIQPTSGRVLVDGEPMRAADAGRLRARVGFLTEAPGLWDRLTVAQNLTVYARMNGLSADAVTTAMTTFGIADRAGDRTAQLSKGLKQRVALARALLHDPDIVLLDEPTSGLDPESAHGVRELILQLRDEGRVVLLSTHNLDEVDRVAGRVAVLRTSLVALDTPSALRARLFAARVRITVRGEAPLVFEGEVDVPSIVRDLVARGAQIEAVVPEEPSLEDIYLRLIRSEAAR